MLKKILFAVVFLFILAAMFIGSILVPAHLQIREVNPRLPTTAELESLFDVASGPVKLSYFITSSQDLVKRTLDHTTFVVEWADGRSLLIDLGMDATTAQEFGKLFEVLRGAEPAVSHGTVASFMGETLDRIAGVGFTHLHLDHVQGVSALCASSTLNGGLITSLHTSDQFALHNIHTADQSELLKHSACIEQIELADGEHSTAQFPGLGIYPLGGHTPGSTLFAIPIGSKLWLLSGDITNSRKDLIENNGKGFFYSYLMVPEYEDRLENLRIWLAELDSQEHITVLASHDAKTIQGSGLHEWKGANERSD